MPPALATNNTHDDEETTSSDLPSHTSELIIHSNASQKSTKMQCNFHSLWNLLIDYFDNPVPDGAVIYAGVVLFQYNEQEGMHMELSGN